MARGDCVCSLNEYIVIVRYVLFGRVVVCVHVCVRACVRVHVRACVLARVFTHRGLFMHWYILSEYSLN